jgi:membrane-bound ClpP family serine protease
MVHWWQDPAVEASLAVAYVDMIFLLLGIYGYVFHLWSKGMLDRIIV